MSHNPLAMRKVAGLLVVLVALSACVNAAQKETLIFEDNFDTFDLQTWEHEITMSGGGNWEFEMYWNNRSNSYVKNSILYIKPTLTADTIGEQNVLNGFRYEVWGGSTFRDACTSNAFYGCERTSGAGGNYINPIQSARLRTVDSFTFKYGRVEWRAKLPRGDWLWPALWLLPKFNEYGQWPSSGEIDVMESRGNSNYPECGNNCFSSTLHWGPSYQADPYQKTYAKYTLPSGDFTTEFHTFGLYWSKDRIYTYLDTEANIVLDVDTSKQKFWDRGQFPAGYKNPWEYATNVNAPFDKDFFLIMNLAVGGTNGYFPNGVGGKPWSDQDQHSVNAFYNAKGQWLPTWHGEDSALQIDWVKVWKFEDAEEEPEVKPFNAYKTKSADRNAMNARKIRFENRADNVEI